MDQHWGKNPGSPYHEESDRTCQECQRRVVCPDSENFHMAEICDKYQDIRNERLDLLIGFIEGSINAYEQMKDVIEDTGCAMYLMYTEASITLKQAVKYAEALKKL